MPISVVRRDADDLEFSSAGHYQFARLGYARRMFARSRTIGAVAAGAVHATDGDSTRAKCA
jgi:hypothetical protein